jgi:hypothetical protein
VLLCAAAAVDLKARRAGRPIRGLDTKGRRDAARLAESEYNMRSHHQHFGGSGF